VHAKHATELSLTAAVVELFERGLDATDDGADARRLRPIQPSLNAGRSDTGEHQA